MRAPHFIHITVRQEFDNKAHPCRGITRTRAFRRATDPGLTGATLSGPAEYAAPDQVKSGPETSGLVPDGVLAQSLDTPSSWLVCTQVWGLAYGEAQVGLIGRVSTWSGIKPGPAVSV